MPYTKFLDLKIELGKARLEDLAAEFGRSHHRTVNYSQRLDKLIVRRQLLEYGRLVAS